MKAYSIRNIVSMGVLFISSYLNMSQSMAGDAWTRIYNATTQPPYNDDGAPHGDYGADIVLDNQGNMIVTGGWHSTFGGVIWSRYEAYNFFVAKYDSTGNILWHRELDTGSNRDDRGISVQVDRNNDIYVLGESNGDVTGSGEPIVYTTPFFAKYSSEGDLLWVDQFGDSSWIVSEHSTDKYGNSYILGYIVDRENRQDNVYVRKYYTNGQLAWHKVFETSYKDHSNAIVVDDNGWYVYFTSTTDNVATTAYSDAYDFQVTRIGNSGTIIWQKQFGTGSKDLASAIAHDNVNRQIIIGGDSPGNILGYERPIGEGLRQNFVAALSIYDGRVKWVKKDYSMPLGIYDISVDGTGGIHLTGGVSSSWFPEYGWGTVIHYSHYLATGDIQRMNVIGTYGTRDLPGGITSDDSGNFYITGEAHGDLNGVASDADITESDLFITKNMPLP